MRVAFDPQIFSDQAVGGISRYYVELVRALTLLPDTACMPRVFAPLHINRYLASLNPDLVVGRRIEKRPPKTGRIFKLLNQKLALRQIERWDADVVHETYYSRQSSANSRAVKILTVFDMIHERTGSRFLLDTVPKLKRIAVERADHIICISESTRQDLIGMLGVPPEKTSVVYLAADTDFWSADDSSVGHGVEKPYLLFVGMRGAYKNFNLLLRAFANSEKLKRDFRLHAFGGGPLTADEMQLAASLGMGGAVVQFSGDDRALRRAYKGATAFVYPSSLEGFGLPPLEAMASGCAVLSSNATSLPEVVGNAALLFDPGRSDELTRKLEEIAYSRQIRESLVAMGLEQARKFSWEKCAIETLAVYRQILDSKNA